MNLRSIRLRTLRLEDRITPATLPSLFGEFAIAGTAGAPILGATAMEFAPDGKLYVLEQGGTMEVYSGSGGVAWSQVAPSNNFFTGSPLTVSSSGERGLLGIAFDPNFTSNRFLYVYYTATSPAIHNRISRFTANAAGTQVVAGSEAILMDLENLSATNHNGGAMHFGPDGKLYVAVGENANPANSQVISNRLGKMLRLNPVPGNVIPADNPTSIAGIAGTTTGDNRAIWAAGLRNPFTFSFHPTTGVMHINDVGQNTWEEVNVGAAGANYGWSATEGRFTQASFPNFTNPIVSYHHSNGALNFPAGNSYTGFAITGGVFYAGPTLTFPASYANDYFFADYVSDFIKVYDASGVVTNFATGAGSPVDLKVGPDGALYYLAHDAFSFNNGALFRVVYTGSVAPYIATHPSNRTTSAGVATTFTVQAGGTGALSYQWQRNDVDIPGATLSSLTLTPPLSENGTTYRVRVTGVGSVTSNPATLTVNANQPPAPTILTPTVGTTFSYGNTINYSGSATDPEDGAITAGSQYTWSVTYWTNVVERPFIPETTGSTSGSFVIPTVTPYTLPDVFYRIYLRVTDSFGNTTTVSRDILPNTAQVTLQTSPIIVPVFLDGAPTATPHVFTGVVGQTRSLGASASVTSGGLAYGFSNWSDGGALVHDISSPASNTTYTANYTLRPGRVATFQVEDGSVQRSIVRSLTVSFDAILSFVGAPGDAFVLTGPGSPSVVVGAIDNSSGRSVIPLTFTGGGTLVNGLYTLTINGSQLQDSQSQLLDGDANGSAGGNYVANFHRLAGDLDGDRDVDNADFAAFRLLFGTNNFAADFDGDGDVDNSDFLSFRSFFGTMI